MEEAEDVQELEEGEENLMINTKPRFEPCPEDDDFLAALDKMVNENIAESKNVVRDKSSMAGMSVPVSSGRSKKNWEQLQQEDQEEAAGASGVQVVLMLRKGGQ